MHNYLKIYTYIVLLLITVCFSGCSGDDIWEGIATGSQVPSFTLKADDGSIVTPESMKGKIYLITFFNTECQDCQRELPVVQKLYDNYRYEISFLNIAREESADDIARYWNANGLNMPYYSQSDRTIFNLFADIGIPRIYLVDAQGTIIASFDTSGDLSYDAISKAIDECLKSDGRYATVSVSFRVSSPRKALADTIEYSYNEYSINSLCLYLYSSETKKFQKQIMIEGLTREENGPNDKYDITYKCKSFLTLAGQYDIFAVANIGNYPDALDDEADLLNYVDNTTYSQGIMSNFEDNSGIVMTNIASDNNNVQIGGEGNVYVILSIDLERVLAKIQLGVGSKSFDLIHDGSRYAQVNLTNYQFINVNTSYYLFRHTAQLNTYLEPQSYVLPDNFAADYESSDNTYVLDPYFFKKSGDRESAEYIADIFAYPYRDSKNTHMAAIPAIGSYATAYILENTCFATSQKNGFSMGLIFKGSIHPEFVYLYNYQNEQNVKESRSEFWPAKLYFWNYHFYGSIRALNKASNLGLDELKDYSDSELKQYGVKLTKYNMGVYETYYTYWIRHNLTPKESKCMKYGIVRNNYYKLLITEVSGLGTSVVSSDLSCDNDDISYSDDF